MAEPTTTPEVEAPADESQAEQTTTTTEAEGQDTQTQTDPQGTDESADQADDNLAWLKKKANIDSDDPDALHKAAEVWRKADRDFHQERREQKSLQEIEEQPVESQTEGDPEIASFKRELGEDRFYRSNPDAEGHEEEIIAAAKDHPFLGRLYKAGLSAETSAQALSALWLISKGKNVDAALKEAEKNGRKQAGQDIARASIAGAPKGSASSAKIADKTPDEERLERFSNW